jgi:hypothetical protein
VVHVGDLTGACSLYQAAVEYIGRTYPLGSLEHDQAIDAARQQLMQFAVQHGFQIDFSERSDEYLVDEIIW